MTIYKLAVTAVASGAFSLGSGVVHLLAALAGVGIGVAAAWLSVQIRRRINEPPIEVSISVLTASWHISPLIASAAPASLPRVRMRFAIVLAS